MIYNYNLLNKMLDELYTMIKKGPMKCTVCKDDIIENTAANKVFYYCRTCKDERTSWGYPLTKPEEKPKYTNDIYGSTSTTTYYGPAKRKTDKTDLYGTTNPTPYIPQTLTQDEIDELFNVYHNQGAD